MKNYSRAGNTRPPDLRNLYAGQEATVRTGCGTPHWFQIGKGVCPVVMYGCESWTINKADRAGEASLAFSCHGAALASWEGERDTVWVTSKAAFQQRLHSGGASLVAELVKNLPATQETGFNSWVGRIPWRRKWQPTSSVLAWRIPWTKEPGKLQSMEWQSPTGLKQRNHHHHIR